MSNRSSALFAILFTLAASLTTASATGADQRSLKPATQPGTVGYLTTFDRREVYAPGVGVIAGSDGYYYGTSEYGGGRSGRGVVYKVDSAGAVTVLHVFKDKKLGPYIPRSGLIEGSDGMLYGTTVGGGQDDWGTVYRLNRDGTGFEVVHEFLFTGDGGNPDTELTEGSDGNLYGTAQGMVFRMSKSGDSFSELAQLSDFGLDFPGPLLEGDNGVFYGISQYGGTNSDGALFSVDGAGNVVSLHDFDETVDGRYPFGRLVYNADHSAFFGVAQSGGEIGHGTIFEYSSGVFQKFVDFGHYKGSGPTPLVLGKDQKHFYGSMMDGTKSRVFSVGPNGKVQTIAFLRGKLANWQPTLTREKGGGMLVMESRGTGAKAGGLFWAFPE